MSLLKIYTDTIIASKLAPYINVCYDMRAEAYPQYMDYIVEFNGIKFTLFKARFYNNSVGKLNREEFYIFNTIYDKLIDDESLKKFNMPTGDYFTPVNKQKLADRLDIEYNKLKRFFIDKEFLEIRKEAYVPRKRSN